MIWRLLVIIGVTACLCVCGQLTDLNNDKTESSSTPGGTGKVPANWDGMTDASDSVWGFEDLP
jgi:hypothetical protein